MKIYSLAHRTDLVFSRVWGTVDIKESYTVISTPSNPDYHAARIYESVGFVNQETTYFLTWWPGKLT